ncbi:SDR family oxidoreductase [Chitinophaga pinensis]|uniref:NmrA family protein n=1 Tax=Chitinophaga pinensis (strain ATCC 43595 / DSM 2588 / LMG 13176 / NBRC 15968 / NCIMB 11800 / UQM 2034) TaxID=485918 RepID=A0A979G842_CHIPD|nr:SDR family oxidoreductase [Chitinophaga pinensis]ACU62515.1 NmrA family protein [Chitinophaga pinensis DSM 2588]
MSTQGPATILITGATGNIGKELINLLSAKGISYNAMVRSIERAKELEVLPGITLVQGNFDDEVSLDKALRGIEKAFLLTNSSEHAEEQQLRFVNAAKRAGVKHIVKLSQWAADVSSPVRFLRYHAAVEAAITAAGMTYTFLRPNLFMQGLLGFKEVIRSEHKFFAAAGEARISLIDIRDIAAVAAVALTADGHENKVYDLTGPESLTHQQLATTFSQVLAHPIHFINVPEEDMKNALLGVGFPEWQADGLLEDYAHYRLNEAAAVTDIVQDVTGEKARTFSQFVTDYASLFK